MCLRITDTVPEDKLPDASWDLSLLLTNPHYYATNGMLTDQENEPGWDAPNLSIGIVSENNGDGTTCFGKKRPYTAFLRKYGPLYKLWIL